MPASTFRPVRFSVTLIVAALLALFVVWPQAYGAQQALVVAQLIAFRAVVAIGLVAAAVVFAAFAVWQRTWGIAAAMAVVLGLASVANAGIVLSRGAGGALSDGDLTVVAWNTQGGAASPESIARLALDTSADVVALPETDAPAVAEAARLLAAEGREMAFDTAYGETGDSWIPTSVLIAAHLGEYRVDAAAGSTPAMPSGVWRPVDGSGPTIVAAHPHAPIPSRMGSWRAGLQWVADRCDVPDVIVAGDMNATVDHLSGLGADGALVGGCQDAAIAAGAGAVGTWPVAAPAWIASPIDHVLVGSAWTVRGAEVITSYDDAGSDHRPVVAVLDAR